MEIKPQSGILQDQKYLGIPFDHLRFVRVIKGLNDCDIDEQGNLSLKLPNDKTSIGMRNTTHGTLNAIVSDHLMGKFSESQFAVVAPLIDMAKNNELISLSPSDTYFWNVDHGVSIPNATLFAPEGNNLPPQLTNENLNIIRYKLDSDPQKNYANMTAAIDGHFKENNLPLYGVDNRSWLGRSLNEPKMDGSGKDTQKIADHIGYAITSGLHDGTAYSELENIHTNILRTKNEFSSVESVQAFRDANQQRMNHDQLPSFAEVYDSSLAKYKSLREELPEHHRDHYDHNVLPEINNYKEMLDQKIDVWYPPEPTMEESSSLIVNQSTVVMPPPLPREATKQPPPIPVEPSNKNQELMASLTQYNQSSHFPDRAVQELSMQHRDLQNSLAKDMARLSINPAILPLDTATNLHTHFSRLNQNNQNLFGEHLKQMTHDQQALTHLNDYVKVTQELTKIGMAQIISVSRDVIDLAPKRDFSQNPELLSPWRDLKNKMFVRMQGDFNNIKDLNETSKMIDLSIKHIQDTPEKNWFQNLTNKNGPLHGVPLNIIDASTQSLDNTYNLTATSLLDAINAPPEAILKMSSPKSPSVSLKVEKIPAPEISENDLFKTKHKPEPEPVKPEEIIQSNELENSGPMQSQDNESKVNKYLTDYLDNTPNKQKSLLSKERLLVEQAKEKSINAIDKFIDVLKKNGLSDNDLIFSNDPERKYPEASYDAKIILDKSLEARMALSHAANALKNYGSLCAVHQEHFSEGFDRLKTNENADSLQIGSHFKEYLELTKNVGEQFQKLEDPLNRYSPVLHAFDENQDTQVTQCRVIELNKQINDSLQVSTFNSHNKTHPQQQQENKNELKM